MTRAGAAGAHKAGNIPQCDYTPYSRTEVFLHELISFAYRSPLGKTLSFKTRSLVQVIEHHGLALKPKFWFKPKRMYPHLYLALLFVHNLAQSATPTPLDEIPGLAPFATATHTYDSNLLNRADSGSGPAPQSDFIERVEIGTHVNFQLSRQKFSGALSLSDNRHQRFSERNTEGRAHHLRWDSEIGRTLVAAVEGRSISDQAPIQTGLITATQRDQDIASASLNWKPNVPGRGRRLSQLATRTGRCLRRSSKPRGKQPRPPSRRLLPLALLLKT